MRNRDLTRQLQALASLLSRTKDACSGDIEMQSHWAKYLCVLYAGFLENALTAVYSEFCRQGTNDRVARFTARSLERISNPKTAKFLDVTGDFEKEWRESLEAFVAEEGRREAIDSIMANRHQIAHGRRSDISLARVVEYFAKAVRVVEFVEDQCDSAPIK